ncbi:alginate export family protein [Brucella sp. 10RB9213]|uniref:alginate export family protein n=1 Tax=Brucella sp. 10RB9213 TaxID=1844039 RepID=UPI0012AEA169|nr:alginate export family protein [Brucella sp. 10RB9213]MRN67685.1 hypothetical protein [Brucella sp. 10RB9213]
MVKRIRNRKQALLIAALSLLVFCGPPQAMAQDVSAARPAVLPLPGEAEGASIGSISVRLRQSSGNAERDAAAQEAARRITKSLDGSEFSAIEASEIIAELIRQETISDARFYLLPSASQTGVKLVFEIDATSGTKTKQEPTGLFLGDTSSFPVLYESNRAVLRTIIGAGLGGYSDVNAWFGRPDLFNGRNPLAGKLPGRSNTWNEGYLELGVGGAAQLGESNLYGFGAVTGMFSWTLGQDIFRDDDRGFLDFEKAYGGVLYVSPENRKNHFKFSAGRQAYTLNDGFLVNAVRGSTSAGERGGLYLGPRLTNDFSVLAQGAYDRWNYSAFFIDPNEVESLESDTTFLGANLRYNFTDKFSADTTLITIPNSKTQFSTPSGRLIPREGLNTVSGHLKWTGAFEMPGLWLEGELAHQFHPGEDVSAWAYYGTVGYLMKEIGWTPSLSYRYAYFSGDDPNTSRYERFDPLLSTGLGIWLQGVSFGKITTNSNLETHRVQFNVAPDERLNLTFDYYLLRAPQLNNLGSNPALSTLTSHDLGQELSLSARWSATKSLYLQALVSHAIPGTALRDIGADRNWTTFQVSLYGGF